MANFLTVKVASISIARILWALGIFGLEVVFIFADYFTGPYLPFTLFYLLLIYFALTRAGVRLAYTIALLSAVGRTFVASSFFPSDVYLVATWWQLTTSLTVYGAFCYLLNLQFASRAHAEKRLEEIQRAGNVPYGAGVAKQSRTKRAFAVVLVALGFVTAFGSDQIFSKTSPQYQFDPVAGKIVQTPLHGHQSPVDNIAKDKILLLTFDDGPNDPEVDLRILSILRKHAAPSIWFVNCEHFDDVHDRQVAKNVQSLLAIARAGHQIANHSYHHVDLKMLDALAPERLDLEIRQCRDVIGKVTGMRPNYFRPPWGEYSPNVVRSIAKSGMRMMNWTANSNDASFNGRTESYRKYLFESPGTRFEDTVVNGDVILLHERPQTADILDQLLTNLEQRGFHFVLPS